MNEGYVIELEQIYNKCVKPLWEKRKGGFYMFEIQPKNLEAYYKYCNDNSSIFRIVKVKPQVNEIHREVFYCLAYSDLDLEAVLHRRFVYTFKLVWYRPIKNLNQVAKNILSPEQILALKIGIGDTGKKPKFKFLSRINQKIFVELEGKLKWYDLEQKKSGSYWASTQPSLFEESQIDIEDVIFFEKFIYKNLDL